MKRVIYAMAEDRRKILDTAYNYSSKIADHIMKCVVYGKSHQDYNGWIEEITNKYIADINAMKPKKGFKMKPRDYKNNLFAGIGTEVQDAKRELMRFRRKYTNLEKDPYPDFEITQELYFRLFDAYWDLADVLSKKLGKYKEETASAEIIADIHKVLDKYC